MTVSRWMVSTAMASVLALGGAMVGRAEESSPAPAPPKPAAEAKPADAKVAPQGKQPSPLDPDIAEAKQRLASMEKDIKDYSFTMVKRERVGDKLLDHEAIYTRIRHNPFSVYMYFLTPAAKKGQQVVYIDGRNNGNLVAQPVGLAGKLGPYHLPTTGMLAMQGQRYPITEIGFVNLTRRLIEAGTDGETTDGVTVKHYDNVKVKAGSEPRITRLTEVTHPVKRPQDKYHIARIYIDKERNIPIRFESYDFPKTPGGQPELLEEYTYADVKLNNGYTDADFQIR
ncbi:MAG: DUF1571 domain-containing protein [Planctomycetes bacterium]|nr:DUF1571 domain-containing protein [Planctomycetota bacterium]